MNGSQQICFTDSAGKALFPFLTMVYFVCSMETGTDTLLFAIVWMIPMQKLTG